MFFAVRFGVKSTFRTSAVRKSRIMEQELRSKKLHNLAHIVSLEHKVEER